MPSVNPVDLCDRLLADAVAILEQRPDLRVVLLSDGAPELRALLREALDASTLGTTVYELRFLAPAGEAGRGGSRRLRGAGPEVLALAARSPQP
jgi:hypothetical protein